MEFSRHTYLTPEAILSEALVSVGDSEMKRLHRGFYLSLVQHCIEEFDLDTLFKEQRIEVPIDKNGSSVDIPQNLFNIKEVYAYSGDICEPGRMVKLWHKDNAYITGKFGRVVAKNRKDGSKDPFYMHRQNFIRAPFNAQLGRIDAFGERIYFYNIENGRIMYSSNVRFFDKLHIHATGFTCPFGEVPLIPVFLRTACVDYVCEAATRALMVDEPQKYSPLWKIYFGRLDKEGFSGSWHRARIAVSRMDKGDRDDYMEYMNRWTWANHG